ncbi:putative EF-hand domain pair protein [Senna tora]|uniref:Putative EF-hand domain pair protein n=1 Tax=Senna tora TaxID=362788 RepID=A0A834X3W8_9FABA|nr:putative EF-hand domain pair protein [Senna tora]
MEEIAQAAKATYENLSEDEKREVNDLFSSMDRNGDGNISLQEFMSFYRGEEGLNPNPMVKRSIFNLVDQNGDGSLQFEELLTLLYIVASRRPTCDGCGVFICGLFFTCTQCRFVHKADVNYDLCINCYQGREFVHEHTEFVDNYVLLLRMQNMLSSGEQYRAQSTASSEADQDEPAMEKMKKAFGIFAAVLSVAANGQTLL